MNDALTPCVVDPLTVHGGTYVFNEKIIVVVGPATNLLEMSRLSPKVSQPSVLDRDCARGPGLLNVQLRLVVE